MFQGGQKAVYKATFKGLAVALKIMALGSGPFGQSELHQLGNDGITDDILDDVSSIIARAKREVAIMEHVDLPVLTKLGPLGLSTVQIRGEKWLYFTEEWIEGTNLRDMIRGGQFSVQRVARLGIDLIQATCWLSSRGLVHRDIKPANVMWAEDRARFVLLDTGIAFDIYGPSLTNLPIAVGTLTYFSPEQMDIDRKRYLDFRSDLFAIGIILYEASVAEHPFMPKGSIPTEVPARILTATPQPVAKKVAGFPHASAT